MTEDFGLLKYYLDAGQELSTEEWEQLLTSGKDLIKARLNSRKVILKLEVSQAAGSERRAAATRYRKKMEEEIKTEVVEVLDHLDNRLAAAEDGDGKFKEFGLKMRDKYVKYLSVVGERHDLGLEELPNTILEQVFSFLNVDSLKAVRLVSRRWKYVAELPSLWSEACLVMKDANYRDILNSELVKVVDSLKLQLRDTHFDACKARDLLGLFGYVMVERPTPMTVVRVLLGVIHQVEDLHLRTLSAIVIDVCRIDPTLFTGLVRLKTCSLWYLSDAQLKALLQAFISSDTIILKSLYLFRCLIYGLSPGLFQAVTKLEELKLECCRLPSECLTAMFEAIRSSFSAGNLKLKKLDLRRVKVVGSLDDPKLLQSIVVLMEECGLDQLTTPRLSVIFKTLSAYASLRHDRAWL